MANEESQLKLITNHNHEHRRDHLIGDPDYHESSLLFKDKHGSTPHHSPFTKEHEQHLTKNFLNHHLDLSPARLSSSPPLSSSPNSTNLIKSSIDSCTNSPNMSASPNSTATNMINFSNNDRFVTNQSTKFIHRNHHQGLLYNLLVSKESNNYKPKRSKIRNLMSKTRSSTAAIITTNNLLESKNSMKSKSCDMSHLNGSELNNDHNNRSLIAVDQDEDMTTKETTTVDDDLSMRKKSNLHYRNCINSLQTNKINTASPYTKPQLSNFGGISPLSTALFPNPTSRLQNQIQKFDLISCKSNTDLYNNHQHHILPKSLHASVTNGSNGNEFTNRQTSNLTGSIFSQPNSFMLFNTTISSSAQNSSTGYGSTSDLHSSSLTSSNSLYLDSDEPIDLTGHVLEASPPQSQTPAQSVTVYQPSISIAQNVFKDCNEMCPYVQLAKKTARPVQARITEWLKQIVEFVALSTPLVNTLKPKKRYDWNESNGSLSNRQSIDDWLSLLARCWYKLLALSMVENALDLVVVEDKSNYDEKNSRFETNFNQLGIPWSLLPDVQSGGLKAAYLKNRRPDRKFANELLQFLFEIRQAGLTSQEFYLLKHVILLTGMNRI